MGAGPAGATAAALMARDGLRVLLVDRARFPRQKICGDAISGKSVDALAALGLVDRVERAEAIDSWGIYFSGAYGDSVEIPFTKNPEAVDPPGYICRRDVFDALLLQAAVEAGAEVWQETTVKDLLFEDGRVVGVRLVRGDSREEEKVKAPVVVGADGAYSVVARKLGMEQLDEEHYYASVRGYFEGVTGFHGRNYIELHFVEEAAPGYFWIFPMAGGKANVGVVMLSSAVKARGIRLKDLYDAMLEHPRFRDRFAEARPLGRARGWGLPLGSKPRPMAGAGWMLVGDAASLIDPFTGEGIGNAMVSGLEAARRAVAAHAAGDFSEDFLGGYERAVRRILDGEMRLSHTMQKLCGWKWPLNFVIRKASRSEELADLVTCMFDDLGQRRKLVSPLFYLRLLTA